MNLFNAKLNAKCVVKSIEIEDEKTKFRLMELGLIEGEVVTVIKRSLMKKTLLISFNSSCFTINETEARRVMVEYA